MTAVDLETTPLFALHRELGGKMVPFAGYAMPVQYPAGIMAEHLHCRAQAALFDVSHMGQAFLDGVGGVDPASALERLVPGAIATLAPGRMRYTLLLGEDGGILDDLMVARTAADGGRLFLVVNAATKDADFALIETRLAGMAKLTRLPGRALLALQGPEAVDALDRLLPGVAALDFMQAGDFSRDGETLFVSRSGYTGEDGFEISVPGAMAEVFARRLLADGRVAPVGLGARDSLRLEAGLCLYGHDLDPGTTPVEADLLWTIPKSRRERADFPAAARILAQIESGPARRRVGLLPEDRTIAREGTEIRDAEGDRAIGHVTSGGFGPSLGGPMAMGYVAPEFADPGTSVTLDVRGKLRPARVAAMPFVPHRYVRKGQG